MGFKNFNRTVPDKGVHVVWSPSSSRGGNLQIFLRIWFKITLNLAVIFSIIVVFQSCLSNSKFIKSELFNSIEPVVRVRIINTMDTVQIRFLADWHVQIDNKRSDIYHKNTIIKLTVSEGQINITHDSSMVDLKCDSLKLKSPVSGGEIEISEVPYGIGWWWAGREDRVYEGRISVYVSDYDKPEVVITLPLEDYLCGVVPYEIGGDSPLEALKAQAVAARSEAIMALTSDLYSGRHHDLTSDVECQVFSGNKKRTERSDRAVYETAGLILTNNGQPINAYYASNCGGHSELIKNVWPERPAPQTYLHAGKDSQIRSDIDLKTEDKVRKWIFAKPDVFCNPYTGIQLPNWSQKNFRWQKKFDRYALTKMISADKEFGQLINIKALKRGVSGRMIQARFVFERDSIDVTGELAIRQMWHPALRSACFVIDQEGDDFILNGAGWGHGVGMCQSGAVAQAIQGSNFNLILEHYYPATEIISIY
jgi:SpoIID/LytB domain protein